MPALAALAAALFGCVAQSISGAAQVAPEPMQLTLRQAEAWLEKRNPEVQLARYPSIDGSSIGFGISIPLFTRHYYEGEILRAEASLNAAHFGLQRIRAVVAGDIARSRADLDSATERVRRHDEVLLPEAHRAYVNAEQAYAAGKLGVMDLLDARRGRAQRLREGSCRLARRDSSAADRLKRYKNEPPPQVASEPAAAVLV